MLIMPMVIKYTVIGGGTAGWLTALFVKEKFPNSDVTVIASSEIGILGAGEGTTPPFVDFLRDINISFEDIISNALGTVKTGIKFVNWSGDSKHYFHNFVSDEWEKEIVDSGRQEQFQALHFDANLLAKYLQSVGLTRGIKLVDSEVISCNPDQDNNIVSLTLKNEQQIKTDFVFDCSGFRRVIIGNYYKSPWTSYSKLLPVNRAMPFFLKNSGIDLPKYTESVALKHGWMWKIPVQGRFGCGYIFDSSRATDEEIKAEIEDYHGHEIVSPRMFSFDAGCYDTTWINNCVAIGLSSGFSEPLEATSIWVQITSLRHLLKNIDGMFNPLIKAKYNESIKTMNHEIVKFLHFHYLSDRQDSNFWKSFKSTDIKLQSMGPIETYSSYNWMTIAKGIGYNGNS